MDHGVKNSAEREVGGGIDEGPAPFNHGLNGCQYAVETRSNLGQRGFERILGTS